MAKNARKRKARAGERDDAPGLAVRRVAADIVDGVLRRHRALDEMLEGADARAATAARFHTHRAEGTLHQRTRTSIRFKLAITRG